MPVLPPVERGRPLSQTTGRHYGPHWKQIALRRRSADGLRPLAQRLPLHEPRVPIDGATRPWFAAETLPVLHLQWLLAAAQPDEAGVVPLPRIARRAEAAAAINEFYSVTLPDAACRTRRGAAARGPRASPFPICRSIACRRGSERDILGWFDAHDTELFEPLEIWHIPSLRDEFRRRVGRSPRPDRSYRPPWPARAQRFGRRLVSAARRRLPV